MKLINPRGKEVEYSEERGKKILSIPSKIKQGWKKVVTKKPKEDDGQKPKQTPKKKVNKQTPKKKVNE